GPGFEIEIEIKVELVHPFGPPRQVRAGWLGGRAPRARPQIASVELVPWSVRSRARRSASRPLIEGEGPLHGSDSSRAIQEISWATPECRRPPQFGRPLRSLNLW